MKKLFALILGLLAFAQIGLAQTQEKSDSIPPHICFQSIYGFPEFPGGKEALEKYLGDNLHYPDSAHINGIEGRVVIKFAISRTGELLSAEVYRSADPILDAEALRVVKAMPRWTPGKDLPENMTKFNFTLPIHFNNQKEDESIKNEQDEAIKEYP